MKWLFSAPLEPVTAIRVIGWWELRRIPFNLIIGIVAVFAFGVFATSIYSTGVLQPGEDAVEPFTLLLAPIVVNICYTAGWLIDAPVRLARPLLSPGFTPLLFRLGLGFSLLITMLPAIIWGSYRLLQMLYVAR